MDRGGSHPDVSFCSKLLYELGSSYGNGRFDPHRVFDFGIVGLQAVDVWHQQASQRRRSWCKGVARKQQADDLELMDLSLQGIEKFGHQKIGLHVTRDVGASGVNTKVAARVSECSSRGGSSSVQDEGLHGTCGHRPRTPK